MYQTCGYQIATANITDQFCMLFDEDIANACEYYNDLNTYYMNGYGYPVNYQPACILLNEFFSIHEQFINGSNTNLLAKFRFAHAETHMPFVSLLVGFSDTFHVINTSIRSNPCKCGNYRDYLRIHLLFLPIGQHLKFKIENGSPV